MASRNPYINPIGIQNSNPHEVFIKDADGLYTQQFKEYLYGLQNSIMPTVRPIPSGVEYIYVDLPTREIKIQDSIYKDFLSIREDHRAETVYFGMDRYYEDVDLMKCSCIIEYINGGNQPRIYPVTLRDLQIIINPETHLPEEKMIIAWNIGNEATAYSGTIKFAITFYKIYYDVDPDTRQPYNFQILYALHTGSAVSTVANGFVYDEEQQKEKDGYYTLSEQHYSTLLAMIDQKNVYWNDL